MCCVMERSDWYLQLDLNSGLPLCIRTLHFLGPGAGTKAAATNPYYPPTPLTPISSNLSLEKHRAWCTMANGPPPVC